MQPDKQPTEQLGSMPSWTQLLAENGLELNAILRDLPNTMPDEKQQIIELIHQGLIYLTEPGQVVELRILGIQGKRRTDSGYFDKMDNLSRAAVAYDGKAEGLYFTLNPVNPALIA